MVRSYLGVVTRKGLELLVPETEQAEAFVQQRIRGHAGKAICCWAVLADPAERQVRLQLRLGRWREALVKLNQESRCLGTMMPGGDDDSLFTAA